MVRSTLGWGEWDFLGVVGNAGGVDLLSFQKAKVLEEIHRLDEQEGSLGCPKRINC